MNKSDRDTPFVVGLTGGIGSGKTVVSDVFAALGVPVIDTDLIAHALTGPDGKAMPALVKAFGPEILANDGRLDRAEMRQRVYANSEERKKLESILHPLIFAAVQTACVEASRNTLSPYLLLVVPLLFESGEKYRSLCQRIIVVDCDEEIQVQRVMKRNGLNRETVDAMRLAQASRTQRLSIATDVLLNEGDSQSLNASIRALDEKFREVGRQTHCFS